ncbi:MAG: DUF11 domain-containing protein [Candidatus Eremiobacteraeota bacterium]|nr:DUF11 domain-containing protein [Candidatus Eremiobacteraeota bacterium]
MSNRTMRTLTTVFAPGTPPLPEGLRTLQVSPSRFVEPGTTVHATFTFRNLGGGTATGFRVRFRLPEGLTYLVGTARIDEAPIDEEGGLTSLLQSSGASIGDVPAGAERRISLAYTVAPTIENGTQIALQAAISSFEVPLIGSNVVRLVVRSRPLLKNPGTTLTVAPLGEVVPGAELQIKAQIHNAGQSSAHDVILLLRVPANTTYVARSGRIDGRTPPGLSETEPFGLTRPIVVAPTLGPGATTEVAMRVRIDPTLEDGTPVATQGAICTQEVAEFPLKAAALKIPSTPSFGGEETSFRLECEDEVVPGQRIRAVVRARNAGTARARAVRIKVVLPDGLLYTPGSRTIDAAPAIDPDRDPGLFDIGDVEPGRSVEVALAAVVRTPIANGQELGVGGRIDWSRGERTFARTLTVRSGPAFPAAFNDIRRDSARRLTPGDLASCTIRLENMGTDAATDVRLGLEVEQGLEALRVREGDVDLTIRDDGDVHLDALAPNEKRTFTVEARAAGALEDGAQLRIRASLRTAQLREIDLGTAAHVVASRPRFSASTVRLVLESTEVLRPNRTSACRVVAQNEGTDRGRDVRVRLQLPDELRLESVDGAARDGDALVFGEIPAKETREAVIHLRLLGAIGSGDVLEFGGRVSGTNVVPFALEPIALATHAEASFRDGATFGSIPAETVDAGQEIAYALALRNVGDGAARRLNIRIDSPSNTVYSPGSTSVNDVPLLDFAGTSPVLLPSGLTLAEVGAGVEVVVRLRTIVNTPLPAGTTIETRAYVSWDETPELTLAAPPLRVRSAPALPIVDPALPFSVLDAAAVPAHALPPPQAIEGSANEAYLELPPAVARNGANGNAMRSVGRTRVASGNGEPARGAAALTLALGPERLNWIVDYLEEARFTGLIGHLMVLRALFPDGAAAQAAAEPLRRYADVLDELVDRLFVKLRLPGVVLDAADLETPAARAALQRVVAALRLDGGDGEIPDDGLRLTGAVEAAELGEAARLLERGAIASAAPWCSLATLLGTSLERDGEQLADFGAYRDALRRTLDGMHELSASEFQEALGQPGDVELEVERENLVRALAVQRNVAV